MFGFWLHTSTNRRDYESIIRGKGLLFGIVREPVLFGDA
jgi:hypothetical protein